jgi:hypothetical protein
MELLREDADDGFTMISLAIIHLGGQHGNRAPAARWLVY